MSKRKHARTGIKSPRKGGPRAGHQRSSNAGEHKTVLALLSRPSGATIATITRSTGWQPHTVRGFLAAGVRKKLGLRLESEKTDGERVYRIIAGSPSDSASEPGA